MDTLTHLSKLELEAGLEHIRQSPKDEGKVMLIVRRPEVEKRETLEACQVDLLEGLVGDNWKVRGSKVTSDGSANIHAQIAIMNSRTVALLAQAEDRWALAGDQLYVDMNLGDDNLPPGTRLAIGSAILEVSALPHTGCAKFSQRFGVEAHKFVNSPEGKQLHLRGINTTVIQAGEIRVGDVMKKI